jgi:sacsin
LIRGYPKGFGIIKEFLQNADDAGARNVTVVFDQRNHHTDSLPAPSYSALAGPALLIVNDAPFTADDFRQILELGNSGKRLNPKKIGRFGLGFNVAYNVSDHPTVLSRDILGIFDPNESVVRDSERPDGIAYELNRDLWEEHRDLLLPFTSGGLQEDQIDLPATIFRLPIRTPELAAKSKISNHPFTADDFAEILKHLHKRAAEVLLFLKNVVSLRVVVIDEEGSVVTPVAIETLEADVVNDNRGKIYGWLDDDHHSVLKKLRSHATPPPVTYVHSVRIEYPEGVETVHWGVALGLFGGASDDLVGLAEEMFEYEDKAVPVAGAAIRIEPNGAGGWYSVPIVGSLFCGLPLNRSLPLPCHLNGYFELDENRTWLKLSADAVGSEERHRIEWNELLVREGCAPATALLLAWLADDVSDAGGYYAIWPDPTSGIETLLPGYVDAVYAHLASESLQCIHVSDRDHAWRAPDDVVRIQDQWYSGLATPLDMLGYILPIPPLPVHVSNGFESAGVPLAMLEPAELRDRLREFGDVDCSIEDAPDPVLRNRNWVMDLFRFSVSDDGGIRRLPLALVRGGKLRTFGSQTLYLASARQVSLFEGFEEWFLEREMITRCNVREDDDSDLYKMTPKHVVEELKHVLDVSDDPVEWNPRGNALPNAKWLTRLFGYLAEEHCLKDPHIVAELENYCIIPDQFRRLNQPGKHETPLWSSAPDGRPLRLTDALAAFRVPLVDGPKPLVRALRGALEHASRELVWSQTGRDLIDTIASQRHLWEDELEYTPQVHDRLLDFLASEPPSQIAERRDELRELPIFPTTDGFLVHLDADDVCVPDRARLPAPPGGVRLLRTGKNGTWRPLLERLGVPILNPVALVKRIIDEGIESVDRARQQRLLAWIRDHWSEIRAEVEPDEREDLRARLRMARLVRGDDGELYAIRELYDPEFAIAKRILGDTAVMPDMAEAYRADPELWLEFFRSIGLDVELRASDILGHIDALLGIADEEGVDAASGELLSVFDYVRHPDQWSKLATEGVADLPVAPRTTFASALQRRAWLPALADPERLRNFAGAAPSRKQLYRAGELYEIRHGHLMASQAPFLPTADSLPKGVRQGLGVPVTPPAETVLDHFEQLLELWEAPEHGGLEPVRLSRSLGAIYLDLGRRVDPDSRADDEAEDEEDGTISIDHLQERFADRACLWDGQGRFWMPRHTFAVAVPFGRWRTQLIDKNAQRSIAYAAFGRRDTIGVDDHIAFLQDVAASYGDSQLDGSDRSLLARVYSRIEDDFREDDLPDDTPIMTRDFRLVPANRCFISDAPLYADAIGPGDVALAWEGVPVSLLRRLEMPGLLESIRESLAEDPERDLDPELARSCTRVEAVIRSPEFRAGLFRLVRHERRELEYLELEWLDGIHVIPTKPFTTELYLDEPEGGTLVGLVEASYFFDEARGILFIAANAGDLIPYQLAQALNRRLGEYALPDTGKLISVLASSPARIDSLLSHLRVSLYEHAEIEIFTSGDAEPIEVTVDYDAVGDDAEPSSATNDEIEGMSELRPEDVDEDDGANEEEMSLEDEWDQGTNSGEPIATNEPGAPSPSGPYTSGRSSSGVVRPPATGNRSNGTRTTSAGKRPWGTAEPKVRDPDPDTGTKRRPRPQPAGPRSSGVRKRVVTYLLPERVIDPVPHDDGDDELPVNRRIGDAAEEFVFAEEQRSGRKVERMVSNNPGFDIRSTAIDGSDERLIEVKGLSGEWSAAGVPLSATQFDLAHREGDKFWLYVVEFASQPEERRLTRIQNPAGLVTQFRIDHGWRALAAEMISASESLANQPVEGATLRYTDGRSAVITAVTSRGVLTQLGLRWPDGSETQVVFQPNSMMVEG